MARQWLRACGPIGLVAALLWTGLTVIDLSSAEARMGGFGGARGGGFGGGFRSGSQGSIGHGFHGGGGQGFQGGVGHRFHPGFQNHFIHHGFHDHFFHDRFHHGFHNHFFFSVGVGGFFPFYPVGYPYPYPVYYPAYTPVYQYQQYSPCGYYDPNGVWINAPCPQYAPPQGVSAPPVEQSGEGAMGSPGY
ncbi:MAG: hypothetical protein HYY11_08665 [Candidatus Methylomirabilis oxyfera]|nr:hypothetical protein [Candidatus Methylomirabilis oxyfera]